MRKICKYVILVSGVLSLFWMGGVLAGSHSTNSPAKVQGSAPLTQNGPTFTLDEANLHRPVTLVAYGDMRFTDPTNETATNPTARRALVARIALEKPDAVFLTGDVPLHGGDQGDYSVYLKETELWRTEGVHIYPALGNHEFHGCQMEKCLENWWNT